MGTTRLVTVAVAVALTLSAAATARDAEAAALPGTTCNLFPADNVWNADISSMPVHASSATWMTSTTPASGKLHPDFGGPPYGMPFNVVDNSHAAGPYTFTYASESDPGNYPYGSDLLVEAPTDSHVLTVNKDTCKLYETFATDPVARTAGSGAIFDLASNAMRPASWTSADAAGLPILPGLVRRDEVVAGYIGHAIRFTVHNTNHAYIWPARHRAGIADPTLPPMGARFRLKAGYNISTYGAEAQVVLNAFKRFGLIVADNGSDWFFQGTQDALWSSTIISDLKQVPVNQFEAVDESSLMVDPNSAQAGRVPSAPAAPTASARDRGAQVTWSAPATGGQPILSYTVTGSPSGQVVVGGSVTTAVVEGLLNGTSYTFTVTAKNASGAGLPSPASNSVVPDGRLTGQAPPAAPPTPGRQAASQSSPPPPPGPIRVAQPRLPRAAETPAPPSPPPPEDPAVLPMLFVLRFG
jgi:hypothetical protein